MTKTPFVSALCALVVLSLVAGCTPADNSTPVVPERHPFRLNTGSEDGAEVSLEGYADGHVPGTAETMRLAVKNNTDQFWAGRLCLQLLEPLPSSVVIPLAEQQIDLQPGAGSERDVRVDLPADLSPGVYGLALVVHKPAGPIVSVTTTQVGGDGQVPFHGQWPTEAALEACPAP
jgi:hypothetical protein